MHRIAPLLVLLALANPVEAETDLQIRAAEIIGYGVFEARTTARSAGFRSLAPAADAVKGVHFVEFTNEIPAELGTGFGLQYVINSSPKGARLDVTNVIHFPGDGLQAPGGQTYKESREQRTIRIGERDFYGYAFDETWEIIPGEWVFEVWYNEARLIRKTFTVVPEEVPATRSP